MTTRWWRQGDDDKVMMTRLYEGTSASDTFDGRCVGHRLKVNFPPSWQKEFQICSLKMKTHLEISNCKRNQAILYCLLTISSNFPLFHLLSIPWLSSFLGLRLARAPWIVESCNFGLVTWSKLTWRKWKKYKTWRCFRGLQLRCSPVLQIKYSRVLQLWIKWIKFCKLLNQITIFFTKLECLKCIRGKTVVDMCHIQTCVIIKLFHKLV